MRTPEKKLSSYFLVQWTPTTSRAPLPRNAILGGRDTDGAQIYVGRASHEGDMIPCKVIPSKQVAYVSHNGFEIAKHNFDILIGNDVKWKKEKTERFPRERILAVVRRAVKLYTSDGGNIAEAQQLERFISRMVASTSATVVKKLPWEIMKYSLETDGRTFMADMKITQPNLKWSR